MEENVFQYEARKPIQDGEIHFFGQVYLRLLEQGASTKSFESWSYSLPLGVEMVSNDDLHVLDRLAPGAAETARANNVEAERKKVWNYLELSAEMSYRGLDIHLSSSKMNDLISVYLTVTGVEHKERLEDFLEDFVFWDPEDPGISPKKYP